MVLCGYMEIGSQIPKGAPDCVLVREGNSCCNGVDLNLVCTFWTIDPLNIYCFGAGGDIWKQNCFTRHFNPWGNWVRVDTTRPAGSGKQQLVQLGRSFRLFCPLPPLLHTRFSFVRVSVLRIDVRPRLQLSGHSTVAGGGAFGLNMPWLTVRS